MGRTLPWRDEAGGSTPLICANNIKEKDYDNTYQIYKVEQQMVC